MKRALLVTFLFSTVIAVFGQYRGLPLRNTTNTIAKALPMPHPNGALTTSQKPAVPPAAGFRVLEEEIGTTNFDIQTLGSLGRRIRETGNGHMGAAWQMAFVQPGFSDRGTGYNHFDGNSWGPNPTDQIESARSGYPSYTALGNGTEVVVSHKALTATSWQLTVYTKPAGSSTWSESAIPSNVPGGNVWAKIAAGGSDGNTLHVVAITLNPAFGGSEYKGMTNHPLYWRSTNGGQTWDKQDIVLPGVDSSQYLSMGAEAYSIEARGETVAISFTPLFGEMLVVKSSDNGETWEKHTVYDFPLDKWNGEPFTAADLPADPNAPDSLYTFSCDAAGNLVIDGDGNAHLFFASLYATGSTVDTGIYLALGTNGIIYWSETNPTLTAIAGAEDWDGDGTLTLGGDIGEYRIGNSGLASFPCATVDEDGNIYLVYTAFHELYVDGDGLTYRHIFITKSEDGGETWSPTFDLINPNVSSEPEFVEAVFASMPPVTDDAIQLIYQQDYVPGLTPDGTTVADQYIMHVSLDKETFEVYTSSGELHAQVGSLELNPNPVVNGEVRISFDLAESAPCKMAFIDMLGQEVAFRELGLNQAGQQQFTHSLEGIGRGVYVVQVIAGDRVLSSKLVIQ